MVSQVRSRDPQPIFIIGSYRSATSVLTWALGQHHNLFPLEETHFLYKLGVDLEYLYNIGSEQGEHSFIGLAGLTPREFRTHLGRASHQLIMGSQKRILQRSKYAALKGRSVISDNIKLERVRYEPKRRWVDGTPENSHYVLPLLRMFPEARFIHVLRNPRRVATSLMHFSTMGATDYTERDAYETWTRLVRDSALSEQAFGPDRVMRLPHELLAADPEQALRRCLEFAGERYQDNCLLPLKERLNSSTYGDPGDCSIEHNLQSSRPWIREAFELYATLTSGKPVLEGGSCAARRLLHRNHKCFSESISPGTNARLSQENQQLRARLLRLEAQLNPMRLNKWGPHDVVATLPFNPQPCGGNALWMATSHAPEDTVVFLDEKPLPTSVHPGGELVTAVVPRDFTASPGRLSLALRSTLSEQQTDPVQLVVRPHR